MTKQEKTVVDLQELTVKELEETLGGNGFIDEFLKGFYRIRYLKEDYPHWTK